jgi:hypothetical protein
MAETECSRMSMAAAGKSRAEGGRGEERREPPTSLSRAEAAVPRADGSMASSVSRSSRAVGAKSLNVSAILRRYGRCGLKSVTSGSFALAQ